MMKAPALNPKALAAALMLLMMAGAADVMAAPARLTTAAPMRTQMRTLMHYTDGAWLARTAVVLKSAKDWNDWNDDMVAQGKAVGREAMPAVDWAKEAVLVVTMGEGGASLELKNARQVGLRTDVELALNWAQAGAAPCHVVAMSKHLVNRLHLVNAEVAGFSAQVPAYQGRAQLAAPNALAGDPVAVSWGAVKDGYLQ
jgi:hypothetical protein